MYSGIRHAELTGLELLEVVVYGKWSDGSIWGDQIVSANPGAILRRFSTESTEVK